MNNAVVRVFYGTDRERESVDLIDYGPKRGSGLSFGHFDVSVPRDHRLAHIERPSIWRFELREDPSKHFVIVARKEETEADFSNEVAAAVAKSPKKDAFVFIHGYKVSFDDAVYRTAQLAYDLGFQGAPILYSWPSNGEVLEYTGDLNNNDWTVPHLEAFLRSVATECHASTVHLIAHSMGNRALSNALNSIAAHNMPPQAPFREVVLTAPDIDADTFGALAHSIESTAARVTLYASANDKALQLSKTINGGYRRAGDATEDIVVIAGMDTIDASALETDFLGHSYYGDRTSVLSDIFALLNDGAPPDHRFGLHKASRGDLYYWKFLPQ
jgi:esterase/lipase superfamily enzyme